MRSLTTIEREQKAAIEELRRTRRLRIIVDALLTVTLMLAIVTVARGERREQPHVLRMHVMESGCPACEIRLKSIWRAGVETTTETTSRKLAPWYPCFDYSDGVSDAGERLDSRQAWCPKRLPVTALRTRQSLD